MKGQAVHELELGVPASKAWELYGTLKLANLVVQKLPTFIEKIEVHGDGGVGTILKLTLPAGTPGTGWYKEKFISIDEENRTKVTDVVEGGFLGMGFTLYRIIFQILEKESDSCIIKSIIEYEVGEEHAANASLVSTQPVEVIAELATTYLTQNQVGESKLDHLVFKG